MPTPSGKPKKGDRIRFQVTLYGKPTMEPRYGTVVERSTGDYYALYVRFDKELPGDRQRWASGRPGVHMLVDAAYALSQGWITFV